MQSVCGKTLPTGALTAYSMAVVTICALVFVIGIERGCRCYRRGKLFEDLIENTSFNVKIEPAGPWIRAILPETLANGAASVVEIDAGGQPDMDDQRLKQLTLFPELKVLCLDLTNVTDDGLAALTRFDALEEICLQQTRVSDAGVRTLARVPTLRVVTLHFTAATDEGVRTLAELNQIEALGLNYTDVSDRGIEWCRHAPSLRFLDLASSRVTPAMIEKLKAAIPQCQLYYSPPRE